ncbi:hypothetical protein [Gardnerella vaginalis]|uniref:hypothetical protein n=1 Tax=Gardnerella vaginalis TaxID=2702 RepID=UPI0039EF64B2
MATTRTVTYDFAVAGDLKIASIASKQHCKSENRENSAKKKNGETWQLFEN